MPLSHTEIEPREPSLEAFLLGQIDFDVALALQQRLVEQARERGDGQIVLLLCEHPALITVGRGGSPGDVAMQSGPVQSRQIEVRWVNRGGGCLMHCPGQLAIYPIVPLRWHGFSVGEYVHRLQAGIIETLDDLNVPSSRSGVPPLLGDCPNFRVSENGTVPFADAAPGQVSRQPPPSPSVSVVQGVWGRTGQLAALGVAVRHWVTYYGAYLNVCPPLGLFRLVETDPQGTGPFFGRRIPRCRKAPAENMDLSPLRRDSAELLPLPPRAPMSSLVAERCGPVRMTAVRAALVRRLAERFGCDRYHLYTGHPMLRRVTTRPPADG